MHVLTRDDGAKRLRAQVARMTDENLARLVWIGSVVLNELPDIPQGIAERTGLSDAELETWSAVELGSGLGIDCLPVSAQLVLGHFPAGLNADGSNLPSIVITDETGDPLSLHPAVIEGWNKPDIPPGYDQLACILFPGKCEFEFFSTARASFGSEDEVDAVVAWPWVEDYRPSHDDWRAIGFTVFD